MYEFEYQMKGLSDEEWRTVDDVEFMDGIYLRVNKATPLISRMLTGEELHFDGITYRIKPRRRDED